MCERLDGIKAANAHARAATQSLRRIVDDVGAKSGAFAALTIDEARRVLEESTDRDPPRAKLERLRKVFGG